MVLTKFRLSRPFRESRNAQTLVPERDLPSRLSVVVNVTKEYTMSTEPSPLIASPTLSLLVLLPASAHTQQYLTPIAPPSHPSGLTSRQSGSSVPSAIPLTTAGRGEGDERRDDEAEMEKVLVAGRRLSLAPGMGAGTQTRSINPLPPLADSPGPSIPIAGSSIEAPPTVGTRPPPELSTAPPAFGAKRAAPSRTPASRRRPQTAAGPAASLMGEGNKVGAALPRGSGLDMRGGAGYGKTRPGWEGDEIVHVLRNSGLEATIVRNTSQLSPILTPHNASPTIPSFSQQILAARPSTPTSLTHVILIPLCDSPSLPSLSLLLAQGTTPTAVVFQQDLLERARRTEDEWLLAAIERITVVSDMRTKAAVITRQVKVGGPPIETPVILAYSANPALSSSTVAACIAAGASGVLKPPYDEETCKLLRRMVCAAREGRTSSVINSPISKHAPMNSSFDDVEPTVILPPTALKSGGEHEGEKILSEAYRSHRKSMSGNLNGQETLSYGHRRRESAAPMRMNNDVHRSQANATRHGPPFAASSSIPSKPTFTAKPEPRFLPARLHDHGLVSLYRYDPSQAVRRRSVDVSGLCIALRRAQRVFEAAATPSSAKGLGNAEVDSDYTFPATLTRSLRHGQPADEECDEPKLAELWSAMYSQTQAAMEIEMDEYPELSTPVSHEGRARLVDALATWDFKPHYLDDDDLFRVACILFEMALSIEGLAELDIDKDALKRLLFALRAIYHAPNPYHNYVHAVDVLQATYTFLINIGVVPPFDYLRDWTPEARPWVRPDEARNPICGFGTRRAREILRPQDVLAVLLAAMGHDVGHPGLSNAFMNNAETPLSQLYEKKSVLERMHCVFIMKQLAKHGFDFLVAPHTMAASNPARKSLDTRSFKGVLSHSVLATDMSLHGDWLVEFKAVGDSIASGNARASSEEQEVDRIMLCQSLIKCADISNPTRPIDVSQHWSTALLKEWAVQASVEQDLGLSISTVQTADAALQAKGQLGFIDYFTQPLFNAASDILPELRCYADWCAENRATWQERFEYYSAMVPESFIVQPIVESASDNERFRSLFPLTVPQSLVGESGSTGSLRNGTAPMAEGPESPAAKAIRAVYHTSLLDQRHRWSSLSRGVPIPGVNPSDWIEPRRMSTPDAKLSSGLAI